jgi:hypothetical protein
MRSAAGKGSTFNISQEPSLQGVALLTTIHPAACVSCININFIALEYDDSWYRRARQENVMFYKMIQPITL